jgi:CheY-like chemotaxis protein
LKFDVRDTGIGIPADKLDRLFKAFSQVDSSTTRKYGGTGLGLAISEKLAGLMGGQISVKSEPGVGSVFSFTVNTCIGTKTLAPYKQYNMDNLHGKTVLVVDDNATNLSILKRQLEHWRLKPLLASSGKEALSVLSKSNGADLVITDMQMPCVDGVMLAERIRELYPGIPLILLSSIGEDVKKEKPGLFASVMNKPIKHHILSKQILNALQQHNGTRPEAVASKVLSADFSDAYPCNILVAEDNPMNQHVITHILKKLGYQPEIAKNGQEAVEAANLKDYTLHIDGYANAGDGRT